VSTQIRGMAIRKIDGAMVSDDGLHMLLRLQPMAGEEIVLSMPADQISALIGVAAQAASGARARRGVAAGTKEAFAVEKWDVHTAGPENGTVVLSLTLAGNAEMSFRLPEGIQQPLIDKLAASIPPSATDPSQIN
jgi:hypothetical protein